MYKSSLKAQAINPHKIYAVDTGLVQAVSSNLQKDWVHKLENIVFLHLRRKYQQIYYFEEKGECDFIAFKKNTVAEIIQVCFELNQDNIERELRGLISAMDYFKQDTGLIITKSQSDIIYKENKKIVVMPAYDYLLLHMA